MLYKAIGIMSGSSLDGLDIAYVHFHETGGKWMYDIIHTDCYPYSSLWMERLENAVHASALDYLLLDTEYGHYIGKQINQFIETHHLEHKVDLIASHGHTSFHLPKRKMTGQLGAGAAIAAETGLPVVSDLRALDVAFGGQGAPIVPIGEKLLMGQYNCFLNLGGIANLSFNVPGQYAAFDVCPANRVLNLLIQNLGKAYDEGGQTAAGGIVNADLLDSLNSLPYYQLSFPKSLSNDFGTSVVVPLIRQFYLSTPDELRTYIEHIAFQIRNALSMFVAESAGVPSELLITGGGAHNNFLVERIKELMRHIPVQVVVPDTILIDFKEACIIALIGVLRYREESNVLASVTGAKRNSINGALWMGAEA